MENAKPYLDKHLGSDDYERVAQTVSAAYEACVSTTKDHPVLGLFLPGVLMRSYLITPFVDHSLTKLEGFTYGFRQNAAQNWYQTTFYKNGLAMTSHFLGGGKHRRAGARQAVVRAELNLRNYDLLDFESAEPDAGSDFLYCHLLHGGYSAVDTIVLAVPSRDQEGYVASMALELVKPEPVQVEEIREEVLVKLATIAESAERDAG